MIGYDTTTNDRISNGKIPNDNIHGDINCSMIGCRISDT